MTPNGRNRCHRAWRHPLRPMYLWFGFLGLVMIGYAGVIGYVLAAQP